MTTYAAKVKPGDVPLVPESGLVLVAKSPGMTSHDVVARVRRLAGTRRVGHAGTLDPMATGVLVVGVEKATRLLGHLSLTEKDYSATIRLGQATVTDDAEGEVIAAGQGARVAASVSEPELRTALATLTGEISQVPPKVSAIKVNGQRAYHLTRSGADPQLRARTVTVWRLELLAVRTEGDLLDLDVEVTCSSGTYIRAIARDLGAALGTGGHLTALRRTRVGPYRIEAARTLDELAEHFEYIPLAKAAAAAFPSMQLDADQTRLVSHGARLPLPGQPGTAEIVDGASLEGPPLASTPVASTAMASTAMASTAMASTAMASTAMASTAAADAPMAGAPMASTAAGVVGSADAETEVAASGDADVPGQPIAAFGPDGSLIALVAERDAELQPLAVFVP
jgi:tRNA pseudouridine55 synthase